MNKKANDMIAGDVFHVGEFIKDEIDHLNMKQQQLADKMGISKSEVSLIIHGKRNITPELAVKLEIVLGIKAEIWMNLQVRYEIEQIKKKYRSSLKKAYLANSRRTKLGNVIARA